MYFLDVTVTVKGKPFLSHPSFIIHSVYTIRWYMEFLIFLPSGWGPKMCIFHFVKTVPLLLYMIGINHKQLDFFLRFKTWHDLTEFCLDGLLEGWTMNADCDRRSIHYDTGEWLKVRVPMWSDLDTFKEMLLTGSFLIH